MTSQATLAAAILAERRRCGQPGERLPPNLQPQDADAALAIQAGVTQQLGQGVAAWKCGLPSEGRPVLAPIYAASVHRSSPCLAWARDGQVRVEPELAFVLGRDLPARAAPYQPAEIDAAIAATHLALELIDSRYGNPEQADFFENLADGLLNQGLYLGPQVDMEQSRNAGELAISISIGTSPGAGQEETRLLQGRHPAIDPRAPLYWLAEFLRSRGQGLQAGQAVITGSYAGSFDLPVGQEIAIQYGELGRLQLSFAAR
ncbi:2-keto-4-pentenoate hydratase [Collimonas pratensis]|uniref:Fumarylacetoacetate (FAA) hydrolase family protein n=1 Tax=Collimonas pratensis TaxID=279113 RepID=A0ABM5Z0D4_9BURK|nr:fumarylacetoacetate hydrolase family protein [Collimonas pratensis]AMP12493.1 fumarylacetoacetate (FAA) hydrolase family protein [Collimonas pratensis]